VSQTSAASAPDLRLGARVLLLDPDNWDPRPARASSGAVQASRSMTPLAAHRHASGQVRRLAPQTAASAGARICEPTIERAMVRHCWLFTESEE
jgi:hypothetical protein